MVFRFSKTASANATADSSINFAEGQAPSSLNDSARAEMARVAQWRDDISGTIATGGTSTAYTVASNQVFDTLAHMDGAMIAFVPHATSGSAPTLSVDGLTAKKIRFQTGLDIPDGVLVQGTPYVVTYYQSAGEFILQGFAGNPYNVPLGGLLPYSGAAAPNSCFVLPYGQAISRSVYSSYFTLVSTLYGSGDGSTTFNVPDVRGRTIFGLDNMGGSAAGRVTYADSGVDGTSLNGSGGAQTVTIGQAQLPSVTLTTTIAAGQGAHTHTAAADANGAFSGSGSGGVLQGGGLSLPVTVNAATLPAMTGTTPLGGSGTALNKMPPAICMMYLLRII